jgi:primosomal protein N' (replication factor Y)
MRVVRVAVPVPQLDALTYAIPESLPDPPIGARVLVPVGKRVLTGVVVAGGSLLAAQEQGERRRSPDHEQRGTSDGQRATIKAIIDILDVEPFVPADVVALADWVAEYYACGAGEAIAAAMPPRAWVESERHAQITDLGHARLLLERGARREVLERLARRSPQKVAAVVGTRKGSHAVLAALERDRLVSLTQPLRGAASAFRTVRVAALTAQGYDCVARSFSSASTTSEHPLRRSERGAAGAELKHRADAELKHRADAELKHRAGAELKLRATQVGLIDRLAGAPEGIQTGALARDGFSAPALARLAKLGLITIFRRRVERDPFDQGTGIDTTPRAAITLTPEQTHALARLTAAVDAHTFTATLLHGVTGSGKTEVYLRLARHVRGHGKSVVVLVPEIALTPAVAAAFRSAFGNEVAIQHSGLSDGERHDQWQRIRRGEVSIVVGTRSAVFAPVRHLGLVIVDEEHDGAYKQEDSPRYHGRDVAVMRARNAGAAVVLGSATPSMESYHNAESGRYALVTLDKRVLDRPMARVAVVDMRLEYAEEGPDVILSRALREAIGSRLDAREQAIVLLNRRGYATTVFCRECAATLECPNCSVSLTVHRAARRARCHYCNYSTAIPIACAHCKGPYLEQLGFGTERVEAEIAAQFPSARVARVDRDTIRRRGAIAGMLARFAAGEIDILVGTQMIAKGHDFPNVTLVGVISADVGLGLADFRAAERTFQLLTQVAGRAGRGDRRGDAIIQTLYPGHYSIKHACRQDYGAFYRDEITFRRAMRYPPSVALINTVVKARSSSAAMAEAGAIITAMRGPGASPFRVLGPAQAPLSRLKGEHRAQFFMKGTHRTAMREALQRALQARPEIARRTIVDVDPMSVL